MEKGTLKIVQGDATRPQGTYPNEIFIIPHVCNNMKKWGAGFVVALSKRFGKDPMKRYLEQCDTYLSPKNMLGTISYVGLKPEEGAPEHIIFNMIAQNETISALNPRPLKYDALSKCMSAVAEHIDMFQRGDKARNREFKYVIHCPKFGSELAGGNFDFIMELINDIWLENGIDVVVYEYIPA